MAGRRSDRRDADPLDARRQPRAGGPPRRQPVLPAGRARASGGRSWDDAREEVADLMIATVDRMRRASRRRCSAARSSRPSTSSASFGLVGGDIMHGALSLDQLYSARPVLGHGNNRSPVPGLYMCGSGTHPGGGRQRRAGLQRGARDPEGPPPAPRGMSTEAQTGTLSAALAPRRAHAGPQSGQGRGAGARDPEGPSRRAAEPPAAGPGTARAERLRRRTHRVRRPRPRPSGHGAGAGRARRRADGARRTPMPPTPPICAASRPRRASPRCCRRPRP